MPIASIILPAFNSERTLASAIASLQAQTLNDWELLIMDDGSTDATVEIARSFEDPRIQVVADGQHRGLAVQLNRAVQMACGRYIARMDADDLAYPDRLRRQVDFLDRNPDVDLLAGWVTVFRSDGTLLGSRRPATSHQQICARPWRGIHMPHPTWMGRAQWFRENPYPENAVRMEDRELLLRTFRKSRFAVIPEMLLAYREDSLSLKKILEARRNTCTMALRLALREKRVVMPAMVILGQCARAVMELVALPTGLEYKVLRSRALPPSQEEAKTFRTLFNLAASESGMLAKL